MLTNLQLSALPLLLDAAICDEAWPAALDALVSSVEAKSALVFAFEDGFQPYSITKASEVLRGSQSSLTAYSTQFKAYEEEAMAHFAKTPPQTLSREVDIWPGWEDLKQRGDFRWTRENYGIYRRVGTRLNGSPAWFDACIVHFGTDQETIPERNLTFIQGFLPSLAKVVELNRFFHLLQAKYQAALAALDHVKIGICIVEPRGSVVVANSEASRILGMGDGLLRGHDQKLLSRTDGQTAQIATAVQSASLVAMGEKILEPCLFAVPRPSGARPFLVEVVPLRDSLKEIDPTFVGAMVSIIDPENPRIFSTRNVAKLYGLSASETEVCRLLVNGLTNEAIAEERSVQYDTIKSQVKAIYRKIGVSTRGDFMREVLTVNPPIE